MAEPATVTLETTMVHEERLSPVSRYWLLRETSYASFTGSTPKRRARISANWYTDPHAVENPRLVGFLQARRGYFDNCKFHRVIRVRELALRGSCAKAIDHQVPKMLFRNSFVLYSLAFPSERIFAFATQRTRSLTTDNRRFGSK